MTQRMPGNVMTTIDHLLTSPERDASPPLPEVTHVNWRLAPDHEAAVIAKAHLANRAAEASVLGGLLQ